MLSKKNRRIVQRMETNKLEQKTKANKLKEKATKAKKQ
jgi:hypothetical protein